MDQIKGDDLVTGVQVTNKKMGQSQEIELDGVFVAIGTEPDTKVLEGVVDLDEGGYIIAGEDGVTSTPGIFCGGDCRTKKLRQIVTSASDGANCIFSAEAYLNSLE